MFKSIMAAATIAAFAISAPVLAKPCKDAKGKFMKCPPAAAQAAVATAAGNVTKDAKGRCHIASGPGKGRFAKCPK